MRKMLPSVAVAVFALACGTAASADEPPQLRWGKTIHVKSQFPGQNIASEQVTITAPPGWSIALDRLAENQVCVCNEASADPKANCPVTMNPKTPERITYWVTARPTADNSQRCDTTYELGYYLVPEKK
jgi:hypothetical protein